MAKANIAALQSHREALIRTTLIGRGYVTAALEVAKRAGDVTATVLHARHLAEIELVVDECWTPAEDVLRLLGKRVRALTVTSNMAPKLVAAARRLIAENERTAEGSHGPGDNWRSNWERDDEENFEAVAELRTWCDAIEIKP